MITPVTRKSHLEILKVQENKYTQTGLPEYNVFNNMTNYEESMDDIWHSFVGPLVITNVKIMNEIYTHRVINIYIHPPFWKAAWFVALLFCLFSGIVYLIYRHKIHVIRKEEQQKAEIKQIRTEAEAAILRATINPDLVFDGLNTLEAYILANRRREATNFIQIFSKLIRRLVENSREELVSLADDIQALKLFIQLEEERYDHIFHTEFDIDTALLENKNQIPPLLIQPFVENAISQSLVDMKEKEGILRIILKCENHLLKVIIEDNAPVKEEPEKMNRNALYQKPINITLKRIAALGHLYESKTYYKISGNALGTRVELLLPLK